MKTIKSYVLENKDGSERTVDKALVEAAIINLVKSGLAHDADQIHRIWVLGRKKDPKTGKPERTLVWERGQ